MKRAFIAASWVAFMGGCHGRVATKQLDSSVEKAAQVSSEKGVATLGCQVQNEYDRVTAPPVKYADTHLEVFGVAIYRGSSRRELIHYDATTNGRFAFDSSDGAIVVDGRTSGTTTVTGMKPLVRTPRVPGSSPRFTSGEVSVATLVYNDKIVVEVSGNGPEYWTYIPDQGAPNPRYRVCFPKIGPTPGSVEWESVDLVPGQRYEVGSNYHKP